MHTAVSARLFRPRALQAWACAWGRSSGTARCSCSTLGQPLTRRNAMPTHVALYSRPRLFVLWLRVKLCCAFETGGRLSEKRVDRKTRIRQEDGRREGKTQHMQPSHSAECYERTALRSSTSQPPRLSRLNARGAESIRGLLANHFVATSHSSAQSVLTG